MKIALLKLSGKTLDGIINDEKKIITIKGIQSNYDGLIIVHGAGAAITDWSKALGYESTFVNGQRATDEKMVEIVAAVQSGLLNSRLVASLNANGLDAVGLSGIDKNLFVADYLNKELGYVGNPKILGATDWIIQMIELKAVPVFSSLCRDKDGNLMNVNADVFAGALAEAIGADTVFFISDVPGVMINGEIQLVLSETKIYEGIKKKEITGGMIPKLNSCIKLLNNGVQNVWIGSEIEKILSEFSSHGTWLVKNPKLEISYEKYAESHAG